MASTVIADLTPAQASRQGWVVRWLYFFIYAGAGIFFTFINVYYRSIGLSGVQIGLINTIAPLCGAFSAVMFGMISDRTGKTRQLFLTAALGASTTALLLGQAKVFAWILLLAGIYALFSNPLFSMMDSTNLRLLGKRSARFGAYRVWGTVGFIVTSFCGGYILERTGLGAIFWLYAIAIGIFAIISLGLVNQPVRPSILPFSGLKKMVSQPLWLSFAVSIFLLLGAATGAVAFIGVMIRQMGGSERLIGFNWAIAATIEIPVMASSEPLLRRFGPLRLMLVAYFGYIIRLILFGVVPTPEWVPIANMMHAFSYVPFWIGAIAYVNELAPPDLKATSQGMLISIMNIANVFGALSAGWLFDHLGVKGMYLSLACVMVVSLFTFVGWHLRLRRKIAL